jgi:hypothetical protein
MFGTAVTLVIQPTICIPKISVSQYVPGKGILMSEILAAEMERITPKIRTLFERDNAFYMALSRGQRSISGDKITVPLNWPVVQKVDDNE